MKQDKKLLSKEKYEKEYCRKVASNILNATKDDKLTDFLEVRISKLRRLCKYVKKF